MAASLIPLAREIPLPIIVVEGFGLLPINSAAFNLLVTSDRREVAIKAEPLDPYIDQRPEVIEERFPVRLRSFAIRRGSVAQSDAGCSNCSSGRS